MLAVRRRLFLSCVFCLWCAASGATLQAQSSGFIYVTNIGGISGSGAISAYSIDNQTGGLLAVPGSPYADPGLPWSLAPDPQGRFVYVANRGSDTIGVYTIDEATGALTPVAGSPFPQDPSTNSELPVSLAVDPAGKFLFVANYNSQTVRAYQIDQTTGALTPAPGSPFPAELSPQSVTVDLSGQFVYVANGYHDSYGTISAYSVDQNTGSLTPVPGSPFSVPIDQSKSSFPAPGAMPRSVTVHSTSSGQALYVADSFQNDIWAFDIDGTTGALALSPASPYSVPGSPFSLMAESEGQFIYTSNQDSNNAFTGSVAGYSIEISTGFLTPIPGSPAVAGSVPVGVAVEPAGRFVYTANQGSWMNNFAGTVSAYSIDSHSGALTPVSGSPFAVGPEPTAVAIIARGWHAGPGHGSSPPRGWQAGRGRR
ncbi:MAG TPA: beta-propeller fold lactonase family protein [Candidatus Cybelea sp.]|nr:beta-propeller fold lactonase family protein [Candidatus Cybelea sp.]